MLLFMHANYALADSPVFEIYRMYQSNSSSFGKISRKAKLQDAVDTFKAFFNFMLPDGTECDVREPTEAEINNGRVGFFAQALKMQAEVIKKKKAIRKVQPIINSAVNKMDRIAESSQEHIQMCALVVDQVFGQHNAAKSAIERIIRTINNCDKVSLINDMNILLNDHLAESSYKQLGAFYSEYLRAKQAIKSHDTKIYTKFLSGLTEGNASTFWGYSTKKSNRRNSQQTFLDNCLELFDSTSINKEILLNDFLGACARGIVLPTDFEYNDQTIADLKLTVKIITDIFNSQYQQNVAKLHTTLWIEKGQNISLPVLESMSMYSDELNEMLDVFYIYVSKQLVHNKALTKIQKIIGSKIRVGEIIIDKNVSLGDNFIDEIMKKERNKFFDNLIAIFYFNDRRQHSSSASLNYRVIGNPASKDRYRKKTSKFDFFGF